MAATIALKCTRLLYCPFLLSAVMTPIYTRHAKRQMGLEPICRRATVEGLSIVMALRQNGLYLKLL